MAPLTFLDDIFWACNLIQVNRLYPVPTAAARKRRFDLTVFLDGGEKLSATLYPANRVCCVLNQCVLPRTVKQLKMGSMRGMRMGEKPGSKTVTASFNICRRQCLLTPSLL
ncbi:hypothetical protein KCP69_25635 [Salmonella enterica subsp. enterica]|nr:hypothetical protein KCP69_25635 [Salmonella enterica subsp. enterica]